MRSPVSLTAAQLRRDVNLRAESYARAHGLTYDVCAGAQGGLIFAPAEAQSSALRHGNFHPASYAAIRANPDWLRRLAKPHTASRRSVARKDWRWMELDSAASSDALLMNVFCHPGVYSEGRLEPSVAALLHVDPDAEMNFGAHPGVPLTAPLKPRSKKSAPAERLDRTEVDLALSGPDSTLFLEAKLTESGFQSAAPALVSRYRDLEAVFDPGRLPRRTLTPPPLAPNVDPDDPTVNLGSRAARIQIAGYQLIRNVLAAYAADAAFCLLLDARRRDLIDGWFQVLSAVRSLSFATRLQLVTWQELAQALPRDLQDFLAVKYGIEPH